MDVFNSRYYNVHVVYLKFLGLWPKNNTFENKIKQVIVVVILVSLYIPQVIRLVEEWGKDMDIVIEVIGSLGYFTCCMIKYINFSRVLSKMHRVYTKIEVQWENLKDEEDIKILEKYADAGLQLTFAYIIPINIILVGYITLPLFPFVLDIIDPLNETRPKAFPYFAEYFIDDQEYYLELTIHGWIVCILSVQIFGTFDTTYTQVVQHACGLFEIVEFVDLIEDCYSTTYLFIVPINTAVLSLAIVDTMLNLEKNNMKQAIRIGLLYMGFSFHMLFNMRPGQRVIDSSSHVRDAAFHCEWFHTSPKTKQLIKFIMLRSSIPSTFTAGKLFLLNYETFFFVFKKSLSYVTVIASMR